MQTRCSKICHRINCAICFLCLLCSNNQILLCFRKAYHHKAHMHTQKLGNNAIQDGNVFGWTVACGEKYYFQIDIPYVCLWTWRLEKRLLWNISTFIYFIATTQCQHCTIHKIWKSYCDFIMNCGLGMVIKLITLIVHVKCHYVQST